MSEWLSVAQDSHRCFINVWQRTSVEHVQSFLLLHREAFLRLGLRFMALSHLEVTKQTYNIRVPTLQREPGLFMWVCIDVHCLRKQESDSGEIRRKSKPVRVRTGCFQHRIPQHQLAGCATTGSYRSWSGPAGGSKHTSSLGFYEIRWRLRLYHHLNYRRSPVPGAWHALAAISYLRLSFPQLGSRTVDGSPGRIGKPASVALACAAWRAACLWGHFIQLMRCGSAYSCITAS